MTMTVTDKAFYREFGDNRINVREVFNKSPQTFLGVCCIMKKDNLKEEHFSFFDGSLFTIAEKVKTLAKSYEDKFKDQQAKFDKKEKFGKEPCAGSGTGFLISKNKIMTARHVVNGINLTKYYAVFNYCMNDHNEVDILHRINLYEIKSIVEDSKNGKGKDWAICELDREVSNWFGVSPILSLNFNYEVKNYDTLSMCGHPSGLPAKFVPEGLVVPNQDSKYRTLTDKDITHTFQIKIAAFHGNSGSPIFDSDWKVVGILIQGRSDYKIYTIREKFLCWELPEKNIIKAYCVTDTIIEEEGTEFAQRISSIKEYIEPILQE